MELHREGKTGAVSCVRATTKGEVRTPSKVLGVSERSSGRSRVTRRNDDKVPEGP